MRSLRAGLVAVAACLAVPALAQADDTICLSDPACPPGGIQAISLEDAQTKAEAGTDHDVVRIGPGTFATANTFSASDPVTLVGAGLGATTIDYSGAGNAVYLNNGQSSVSRLTARITDTNADGIYLGFGADAFDPGSSRLCSTASRTAASCSPKRGASSSACASSSPPTSPTPRRSTPSRADASKIRTSREASGSARPMTCSRSGAPPSARRRRYARSEATSRHRTC